MRARILSALVAALVALYVSPPAGGQERPYFVTYSHQLEEPGNLEIGFNPVFGTQRGGNDYLAESLEFEYGAKGWWTTEFYLDGQSTFGDSTILTGFRWENRFRPLMHEHWINPVLYVEFENISGADKTMKEVVGFDGQADHAEPNSDARQEHEHELETKLILSSNFKGWNLSENFIGEKNLGHDPWEFGYAVGASRHLALAATARTCRLCRENFIAGVEFYGGLGTSRNLTTSGTAHYVAPIVAWQLPSGATLRISPGWGLSGTSHRFLMRWGVAYEISALSRRVRSWFR